MNFFDHIVNKASFLVRSLSKLFYGYVILPMFRAWYAPAANRPLPEECSSILVNLSDHTYVGLGDAVIYSTLIKILRTRFPKAKIVLLAGRRNRFLDLYWKRHAGLDGILIHPPLRLRYLFSWIQFFYRLKRFERFDMSIVQSIEPVRNLSSTWFPVDPALSYLAGIKNIVGFYDRWNEDKFYLKVVSQLGVDTYPSDDTPGPHWVGPHWTEIAREYGKTLGLSVDGLDSLCKPSFYFHPSPLSLEITPKRYKIAVNPGGDQIWNRRWPMERYAELCIQLLKNLDSSIFLVGGPEELQLRLEVSSLVKTRLPNSAIYVVNAIDLAETANYIYNSDVFVGNDSGVTHLATALETKIVAIYGPSNFAFWGPHLINAKHKVVSLALPCMPCEHQLNLTGIAGCLLPDEKFKCLSHLDTRIVYDAIADSIHSN